MDFIADGIAARTHQKAENHLRIGLLTILGRAGDADYVLTGLEVHRGRVIEDHRHSAAKNPFGLFVGHLFNFVLDIVGLRLPCASRSIAELVENQFTQEFPTGVIKKSRPTSYMGRDRT